MRSEIMTTFSRGWIVPVALGAALALAGPVFAQQQQMPMQAPSGPQLMQPGAPGYGQGYPGPMGQGGWMQSGPMQSGPMPHGGPMGPGWMPQGGQQGPGNMMPPAGYPGGTGPMAGAPGPMGGPGHTMGGPGRMMGGPGMMHGRGPGMMQGRGCPMMGGQSCPMMGGMHDGADDGQPPFIAGRIAFLRAELGITDSQQPAFEALAAAMRRMYEGAAAARMAMHGNTEPMGSPVERLGARIAAMEGRLSAMKEVKQALDKLYAVLTEEQRQRANHAMRFGMGRIW
jgi:hypothetical protein